MQNGRLYTEKNLHDKEQEQLSVIECSANDIPVIGNGEGDSGQSYSYKIENSRVIITGFEGLAARIELPSQIEGAPVTAIDRKAFLREKSLYRIILPDTLEEIGDWAFASCENLTELSVPEKDIRFGKAIFKNCTHLKRIWVRPCHKKNRASEYGEPELLAAAVTGMEAYYLLDIPMAGKWDWLGKWDTRLISILRTADQEGYISQSVYGEEDYIGTDLEEYISERRKAKVRLAFLRLRHPRALDPALKAELEQYLRSLTKGCEGEEAWQVLREEHGEDREYYSLFAEIGCITEENLDGILADIGEGHPEMKAFFLTREQDGKEADFFAGLEL